MSTAEETTNTMGAMFIGLLLATSLWGASNLQLVNYFRLGYHDDRFVKILVVGIWLADTVHQVLVAQSLYEFVIVGIRGSELELGASRPLALQYIFQAITTFAVQSFYAYRIWILRKKRVLSSALIVPFIAGSFAMTLYVGYDFFPVSSFGFEFENSPTSPYLLISVFAGTTFAADLLIAGFLFHSLRTNKSAWSSTQSVIDQLVVYCIGTGAVTSLCALATLLTVILAPGFVYLIFFMVSGRLYTNSMLASLNARKQHRRMQAAPNSEPLVFLRAVANDSAQQHQAEEEYGTGIRGSQTTIYGANEAHK